jgi:aldose 1-epimerase
LHLQHGALPRDTLTWFCETHGAKAVIDHPDSGRRITLTSHQSRYLVVHHRAGERFLCIEPSSHLAGRLDPRADAALPGEAIRLDMRLQLE